MAACHSQSPDHSLLLGRLPQATTSWSMPHGRMPLATTSQSMPHGRLPLAITSQSMPHGRLPLPVSKNRDGHAIMPLGCLPLSNLPFSCHYFILTIHVFIKSSNRYIPASISNSNFPLERSKISSVLLTIWGRNLDIIHGIVTENYPSSVTVF